MLHPKISFDGVLKALKFGLLWNTEKAIENKEEYSFEEFKKEFEVIK